MKANKKDDFIEIFAGSPFDAEIVKSLLNDSNIEVFFKDEIIGTLAPWHVAPGGAGAVKVIIRNDDYEQAKLIVSEYERTKK